jgi:shikimate kinase
MEKENIYLTGFMGAGKSTVGELLARELGRDFVDLDDAVETRAGKKIARIFEEDGVEVFRELEGECLALVSRERARVVALGGGAITRFRQLSPSGRLVYLKGSFEVLVHRARGDTRSRPLLSQSDEALHELYRKREPEYECASLVVQVGNLAPAEVAQAVCQALNAEKGLA